MALINNIYVFVSSESVSQSVESTSHPVEKGFAITDHVQKQPIELSLSGKFVDNDKMTAAEILEKITQLKNSGSLITFKGRNTFSNLQIKSFSTNHPYTNWGGCDFNMTLKEVRIAKPAYTAPVNKARNNAGTQQVQRGTNKNVYHTVKRGDCIWNLVTKQYKSLEPKYSKVMDKCNWVMKQNPKAFSRRNDFRTLQIGKKILIGYRK